jgi:hypothetical protein
VGAVGRRPKENLGIAADQLLAKLSCGRERGKRDDDGADSCRCQHADHKRCAVGVTQTDMAAFAGAQRDENASQLRGATVGVGVADAFGVAHQQRMITSALRLLAQDFADGWRFTRHGRLV